MPAGRGMGMMPPGTEPLIFRVLKAALIFFQSVDLVLVVRPCPSRLQVCLVLPQGSAPLVSLQARRSVGLLLQALEVLPQGKNLL